MKTYLLAATMLLAGMVAAQTPRELLLYPHGAPQSNRLEGKEQWDATRGFLQNVATAKLFVYLPDGAAASQGQVATKAVVICPGGGYSGLSMEYEGHKVAQWLTARGIAGIVLQYRMPDGHHSIPLGDLHEAVRTVRSRGTEWNIDPAGVGIMGFSAGGHLAAMGAVRFDEATRPDFAVLIYPVISLYDLDAHSGSRNNLLGVAPTEDASAVAQYEALAREYSAQLHVTSQTPPTFLAISDDDPAVSPRHVTMFYDALKVAGVPAELHIWPSGRHGWGWRENFPYRDEFFASLERWLLH